MTGLKRVRKVRWLIYSVMVVMLFVAGAVGLPLVLIVPSQTLVTDVILHMAISPQSDADEYVASLYRQRQAEKIVCISQPASWDVYPADFARQHLIALGVPAENVTVLHLPLADCRAQHLPLLIEIMQTNGWQSALLVSAAEESRFSLRLARRYFARAGLSVAITCSPREAAELRQAWWRTHWKVQRIVGSAAAVLLDTIYAECW